MTLVSLQTTDKINTLLNQAYTGRTNNLPKSITLAKQALELSKEIGDKALIGNSLNQLSLYYMITSEFKVSVETAEEAISYFEALGDDRGIATAKFNIGSVNYKSNNYHLGLVYLIDALIIYRKHNDLHNQSKVEKAVGTIYEYIGDNFNAFKAYKNGVSIARKIEDLNLESNVFNNLSGLLLKEGRLKFARKMIEHSIKLKQQTNDIRGLAFAIYGRGKVNAATNNFKQAEADYLQAIETHKDMGENLGAAMALRKLGDLYLASGALDKAKFTVEESIILCEKHNISMLRIKNYHVLYRIAKARKDNLEALEYLELYLSEKEAVINSQTLKTIENYELINKMNKLEQEALINKEKQKVAEKKNADEKEAVRLKQEFLSIMSHEIRTPLNAITTIVSLLSKDVQEKDRELFKSLQFASKNLITIVNDILDFTKLDSNKAILEEHATNFNTLCQNVINLHLNLAKDKGLKLRLINSIPRDVNYMLDQTKVSQILSNLIHNAIKFTSKGSVEFKVEIKSQTGDYDNVRFSIKDTGEGVLKENIAQIFESFSQVKPITTRTEGGTGLGLAIVDKLVKLHGGKIKLKSKYNEGSEFYFTLKLERNDAINHTKSVNYDALQGKTVLIAEDTPINALLMKKVLANWGITSKHVVNGKLAFEAAKIEVFDFILMDIHMPEMNGFEATRKIKSEDNLNKNTPIFAVTADVLTKEDKKDTKLFEGVLWKPLEIEKMFNTIINVLH